MAGSFVPIFKNESYPQISNATPSTPVITAVDKLQGFKGGGNTVIITGHDFKSYTSTATQVFFGSTQATVLANTSNTIVVTLPSGIVGNTNVTVVTPAGTSAGVAFNYFNSSNIYNELLDPANAISALPIGGIWDGGGGLYVTAGITITQPCTIQNATIINPDYFFQMTPDLVTVNGIANTFGFRGFTSTNPPTGIIVGLTVTGAGISGKSNTTITSLGDYNDGTYNYCVAYLTPSVGTITPVNGHYNFFCGETKPHIKVLVHNNATIANNAPALANGRTSTSVSGTVGSNTIYDNHIRASKTHTVRWSPNNPTTIYDSSIDTTDLWSTVRGPYIPHGAYVGAVVEGKSFSLVNSGGGPLSIHDISDPSQSFNIYIGGDQGKLVTNGQGTAHTSYEFPTYDTQITSGDVGSLVTGITTTTANAKLSLATIDRVVPGILFTMVDNNGNETYTSGAATTVIVGCRKDPVTTTVGSPNIVDPTITSADAGKLVTMTKGLILGYVGTITGTTFQLVNAPTGGVPVNITNATITNLLIGGRIDGSSGVGTVNTSSISTIYDPTISSSDTGRIVQGTNIPVGSFVGTVSGNAYTLVNAGGGAVATTGKVSTTYVSDFCIPNGTYVGPVNTSNCTFTLLDVNGNPVNLLKSIVNGTNSIVVGATEPRVNLYNLNILGTNYSATYNANMVGGHGVALLSADSVWINNVTTRFTNGDGLDIFFGENNADLNCSNLHVSKMYINCAGRDGVSPCSLDNKYGDNYFNDVYVGSAIARSGIDFESDLGGVGVGYIHWYRCTIYGLIELISSLQGPMEFRDLNLVGEFWYNDSTGIYNTTFTNGTWNMPVSGVGINGQGAFFMQGGNVTFTGTKFFRNHNMITVTNSASTPNYFSQYMDTVQVGNRIDPYVNIGPAELSTTSNNSMSDSNAIPTDVGKTITTNAIQLPTIPYGQLSTVYPLATPNYTNQTSSATITSVTLNPSSTKPASLPAWFAQERGGWLALSNTYGSAFGPSYYATSSVYTSITSVTPSAVTSVLQTSAYTWITGQLVYISGLSKKQKIPNGVYKVVGIGTNSFTINIGSLNGVVAGSGLAGLTCPTSTITHTVPVSPLTYATGTIVSGTNIPMGAYVGSITQSGGLNTSFQLVDINGSPIFPLGPVTQVWFGNFSNYFTTNFPAGSIQQIELGAISNWERIQYIKSNARVDQNGVSNTYISATPASNIIYDTNIVPTVIHTNGQNGITVSGNPYSNIINDSAILPGYVGRLVTGENIPAGAYVGSVNMAAKTFTLINNFSPSAAIYPTGNVNSVSITGDSGALVIDSATPSNIPFGSYVGNVYGYSASTPSYILPGATPSFQLVNANGYPINPAGKSTTLTIGGGLVELELETGPRQGQAYQTAPSIHPNVTAVSSITSQRTIEVSGNTSSNVIIDSNISLGAPHAVYGALGSNIVTDSSILPSDIGSSVIGNYIPAGTFVGTVTQGTYPAPNSFTLVDQYGNTVYNTASFFAPVSAVVIGGRQDFGVTAVTTGSGVHKVTTVTDAAINPGREDNSGVYGDTTTSTITDPTISITDLGLLVQDATGNGYIPVNSYVGAVIDGTSFLLVDANNNPVMPADPTDPSNPITVTDIFIGGDTGTSVVDLGNIIPANTFVGPITNGSFPLVDSNGNNVNPNNPTFTNIVVGGRYDFFNGTTAGSTITDSTIQETDLGKPVTGVGIPAGAVVGKPLSPGAYFALTTSNGSNLVPTSFVNVVNIGNDNGALVSGYNIPLESYVSQATPYYYSATPQFKMVDNNNAPQHPSATITSAVIGGRYDGIGSVNGSNQIIDSAVQIGRNDIVSITSQNNATGISAISASSGSPAKVTITTPHANNTWITNAYVYIKGLANLPSGYQIPDGLYQISTPTSTSFKINMVDIAAKGGPIGGLGATTLTPLTVTALTNISGNTWQLTTSTAHGITVGGMFFLYGVSGFSVAPSTFQARGWTATATTSTTINFTIDTAPGSGSYSANSGSLYSGTATSTTNVLYDSNALSNDKNAIVTGPGIPPRTIVGTVVTGVSLALVDTNGNNVLLNAPGNTILGTMNINVGSDQGSLVIDNSGSNSIIPVNSYVGTITPYRGFTLVDSTGATPKYATGNASVLTISNGRTDTGVSYTNGVNSFYDANVSSKDVGSVITGPNIPYGAIIASVNGSANTFKISNAFGASVPSGTQTNATVLIGGHVDSFGGNASSSTVVDSNIGTGDVGSTVILPGAASTILGPNPYYFVGAVNTGVSFTLVDGNGTSVIPSNPFNAMVIGGRVDGVINTVGSSTIYDVSISASDQGNAVSGAGIPANSYIGNVQLSQPSFTLVDIIGSPVATTANVSNYIVIGGHTYINDPYIVANDNTAQIVGTNLPSYGKFQVGNITSQFNLKASDGVTDVYPAGTLSTVTILNPLLNRHRTDTVTGGPGSPVIYDPQALLTDQGTSITGFNIPAGSKVGPVTTRFEVLNSQKNPVYIPALNAATPTIWLNNSQRAVFSYSGTTDKLLNSGASHLLLNNLTYYGTVSPNTKALTASGPLTTLPPMGMINSANAVNCWVNVGASAANLQFINCVFDPSTVPLGIIAPNDPSTVTFTYNGVTTTTNNRWGRTQVIQAAIS